MRIDQVLVSASPGDAITNFAQCLRQVLSPDRPSEVFAHFYDPALKDDVKPLRDYACRAEGQVGDLLVLHVSIGEPDVADFVLGRPERLVVIYHNISPSAPFRAFDPGFADLLDRGRDELRRLQRQATAALCESEFNAAELRDLGFPQVAVVPLIVELDDLTRGPEDAALAQRLDEQPDGPVVLAIGQLLPHKRMDYLVEAFHILSTYLVPDARLIIVGSPRLPPYARAVQTQIDELHLDRAWLTGSVSQPELSTLLRRADLFVTASEHEGFCVPLLEAMAFDLPFQARRFGAVPETAGPAGLLLDPGDGPAVAAEAWAAVLGDASLRRDLVERGRRRLADFNPVTTKERWRLALTALL